MSTSQIFGWRVLSVAIAATVVLGSTEPTAELMASYSLAELSVVFSVAYVVHGGEDLLGSTIYGVDVYRVTYTPGLAGSSTPGASRALELSGLLIVPNRPASSLISTAWIHGTTTLSTAIPSAAFDNCNNNANNANANASAYSFCIPDTDKAPDAILGALSSASMGYLAIVPDGIGYGSSGSQPASYLIAEDYAISTFNLHAAAVRLVPTLNSKAGVGPELIVAGYSEGGYGALAVHRLSYEAEWTEAGISVVASFPSAGPYDLEAELARALSENAVTSRPAYLLYLGFSYWTNLGVSAVFNEDYITYIEAWYDGSNDGTTIDSSIATTFGENNFLTAFDSTTLSAIRAGQTTDFSDALHSNNLIEGWVPESSIIRLCHGTTDEVVAYKNAENLIGAMEPAGVDISLTTYGGNDCSSHTDCAPLCMKHTLKQMWEYEGKWNGALKNDNGVATAAIVGSVIAVVVVGSLVALGVRKYTNRDHYEMIA